MRMIVQPNFYPWYREVLVDRLQNAFNRHLVSRDSVAWRFMINPENAGDLQIWIIQIDNRLLPLDFIEEVKYHIVHAKPLMNGCKIQVRFDRTGYTDGEIEADNKRWNTYREEFEVVT